MPVLGYFTAYKVNHLINEAGITVTFFALAKNYISTKLPIKNIAVNSA